MLGVLDRASYWKFQANLLSQAKFSSFDSFLIKKLSKLSQRFLRFLERIHFSLYCLYLFNAASDILV